MEVEEIIKQCTIENGIVFLPKIMLDRKVYQKVAFHLESLGGKWNTSKKGFIFSGEIPSELLPKELPKHPKELKKEFQCYFTPKDLADRVAELTVLDSSALDVLEPSAGEGSLLDSIMRRFDFNGITYYILHYCELFSNNIEILKKKYKKLTKVSDDFMNLSLDNKYDRIIANPPFNKNQDIIHIRKMFDHLKPNGILVAICSNHWKFCNNKKESDFKAWLETTDYDIEEVDAGTFSESGTNIACSILIIRK